MTRRHLAAGVLTAACIAGCDTGDAEPAVTRAPVTVPVTGPANRPACVLRLHGKGGAGGPTILVDGITQLAPDGNAEGWGARQWLYFPDDRLAEIVAQLTDVVAGCAAVAVDGFSNGAALAAKLYCRGETFDGTLVGVVIDDPVPDHGADDCTPAPGVPAALYWTGGLADTAIPGADCGTIDWTCEGGETIGIDAYAAALGLPILPSPHTDHVWYTDPPELAQWLRP